MLSDPKHTYKKKTKLHNLQVEASNPKNHLLLRLRSASPLLLLSGCSQLLIGLIVVTLSITGFIVPLWVASFMSVIGSVTTMGGAYILYEIFSEKNEIDNLYKSSVKRVINSQN